MKKQFKFLSILFIFGLLFTNFSCQVEEAIIENDSKSYHLKTTRVSINQVLNEINSNDIKQKLQNNTFDSSLSNSLLRSNESDVYFIKKEKDDELTSYILHLNTYSTLKPYFLKLIITKNNNETERMGYIKYIPTSPISTLDMATFTGEVQILDTAFEISAKSEYINGQVQEIEQNSGASNRVVCVNEVEIREVKCSHSGQHGVGQSCENGYINDAHYEIIIFERCTNTREHLVQIIEDYGNGNDLGGSFSTTAFLVPFLETLSDAELAIYVANPSIQDYLVSNLIVVQNPNYNPILGGDPNIVIIKPEAEQFVNELIDLALNEEDEELIPNLINLSIVTKQNGYFENPYDSNYFNLINPYTEVNTQLHNPIWTVYFTAQCAIARYKLSQEPGWNNLYPWVQDAKVYWEASKEMLHLGLDLIGLVPLVGEVADLTNGVIYTIEGDGINASLSYASTIPVGGWFAAGAKLAKRADGLSFAVKAGNTLIDFGKYNSKKFRAALGLVPGDPRQAHHLIPRGSEIINHEVVQRATQANVNQGFHIDQALNGIPVAAWRNQPNHPNYNNLIRQKLVNFLNANPNATPTQCYNQLMIILNQAKQAVINNPNTHLNDLIF